jgi:hypothetical protein
MLNHLQHIGDASKKIDFDRITNVNVVVPTSGTLLSVVKTRDRGKQDSDGLFNRHQARLLKEYVHHSPLSDADESEIVEYIDTRSLRFWRRFERFGVIFGSDLSQRRIDVNRASHMVQFSERYASDTPGEEEIFLQYGRVKYYVELPIVGVLALVVNFRGEKHWDPADGHRLTTIESVEGR